MEPWADDLANDLQSVSFTSAATTVDRSTSSASRSSSSAAGITPDTSAHGSFSSSRLPLSLGSSLSLSDLQLLRGLGSGDIGSVFLAELKSFATAAGESPLLAAKVMDKKELVRRSKEGRAKTEREILESLDHPFLPTLFAAMDSPKWLCLLTEFCPGGDLHVLRQKQPFKRFHESAVRFYASEVIVALEYLHMMGIVYRDLKPENVLVRSDGHIMLTDFDLSLKCDDSASTPQIVLNLNHQLPHGLSLENDHKTMEQTTSSSSSSCIIPNCIVPAVSCFNPKMRKRKKKTGQYNGPELMAEPVDVRTMSFVGTHEYLAPEIVSGEGHGSPVDWWTLGIFMFEMFYGVTPFKAMDHELTLANIVARALEFPKEPTVPATAKELLSQLLAKDPTKRLGSTTGASALKRHSFFQGVNWALLRCTQPPYVPPPFSKEVVFDETSVEYYKPEQILILVYNIKVNVILL